MKQNSGFNNILDECLERLLVGGETLEGCLASYPEQAVELRPLLQTAVTAKKALAVQPPPQFKAAASSRFRAAVEEKKAKKARPFFIWQPRWATVVVSLLLVLLLTGGSVIVVAGDSMPGESLYSVKLAVEQVLLTLSPSAQSKAKQLAKLADRRVAEIIYLAQKGDAQQIEAVTQRLNNHLTVIISLLSPRGTEGGAALAPSSETALEAEVKGINDASSGAGDRTEIEILLSNSAVQHQAALTQALEMAPDSAKAALYQAIVVVAAGYQNVLSAIEQ